ncbi:ion transporter [Tautonia rosea]|uniref:ion transporter n=1 Tax=Tautonia rosea TaxID=2728037 RepID=UPI001475DA68|nr:ion transporter [Tautonia rosea]
MSDPIEWRNSWLERTSAVLSGNGHIAPARLLNAIQEGTRLRRVLHELAIDPIHPRDPEVDVLLERLRDTTTDHLADLQRENPGPNPKLSTLTSKWLRAEQAYLGELLTRPDLEPIRRTALLDRFRRDLTWASELVALVDGNVPVHPAVSAVIELDRLQETILADGTPSLDPIREQLTHRATRLRWSLLDRRVSQLLEGSVPEGTAEELWSRRFLLSRLQAEVEGLPESIPVPPSPDTPDEPSESLPGPRRHVAALIERREALADAAAEQLRSLSAAPRSAAWDELLTDAREEANELLSMLEEVDLAQGVRLLALSREDMLRLRDDCVASGQNGAEEGLDRPTIGHLRRVARRFGRMARTARNEWQEKDLTARMKSKFGPRFPKRLDAIILVLILVLTGLLVVETVIDQSGGMTHRLEAVFAWADLAICAVFLTEFTLKISLATGKLRYLARHFVIDLLPSIPFGFITFALSGPTLIANIQILRLLRVPRLLRFLRVMRPLIRFVRLLIFALRFTDRLVRRYARIFNRNIILFELKPEISDDSRNHHLLHMIRRHFDRRASEHFGMLDESERLALTDAAIEDLESRVSEIPSADWSERVEDQTRDIPIEEVVERLIELTPEELIEQMGQSFVNSVDHYLQLIDLPVIRRLPIIRPVLEHRKQGSAEAVALAANYLGHLMQRTLDVIYYVADLQATVSPPLFLDKLGRTIVSATKRPAIRLLSFGLTFAALYALVYLLVPSGDGVVEAGVDATREVGLLHGFGLRLRAMLGWFADKLGLPVIVIGVVCFVLMQVGGWFRKIANQAAEFCERIVEAQFAAQTKLLKRELKDRDQRFLDERVVLPEIRLRTSDDVSMNAERGLLGVSNLEPTREPWALDAPIQGMELKPSETDFFSTLKLLYQDYLDGSPFHRNDTKASTQLLGNLALRNLSLSNLPYFLRGRRRLDRLDMSRAASSLLGGPYLWFDYITRMIVQETAKLLIDYNRNAVPLDRLASSPEGVRKRYRKWLAARLHRPEDEIPLPEPQGRIPLTERLSPSRSRPEADEFFETVDFTAVDFLIADPERDELIRLRYGDAVASLLQIDRERNLRSAFRSLPLHRAPISQRTINLFHLYESYLAGGRLLILPFRMVWWGFRGLGYIAVRIVNVIREILNPTVSTTPDEPGESYQAAVRKIHRMRKPAFLEALWMRARFDVEYLGLPLPQVPISVGSDSLMEIDLDFIGASRHERVMAERFRNQQHDRIEWLNHFLSEFQWNFDNLPEMLGRDLPHLTDRRGEVIRALVTAWVADHDDVATLGLAVLAMRRVVSYAADSDSDPRQLPEKLPDPPNLSEPLWHRIQDVRRPMDDLLELPCFPRYDAEQRLRITAYLRRHRRAVREWVRVIRGQGGPDPIETLRTRFVEVMLRTDLWSDQILTLRAVQTLTMLDVQHYIELVWNLGGYDRLSPVSQVVDLPFADPELLEEASAR